MNVINVYVSKRYTKLPFNTVFVFGSNLSGFHGAGAAKDASEYFGAIYGKGNGLQGNSYGIPTKDEHMKVLPLITISKYVSEFLEHAVKNPNITYLITPIGTGLSRLSASDIAPLFKDPPPNCLLPSIWSFYYKDSAFLINPL